MEENLNIYDIPMQKGFEIMRGIQAAQSLDELKKYGNDLHKIINSYDPENSRNEDILMNAQTIAICVMEYVAQISQVAGGEIFAPLIMQHINMPELGMPGPLGLKMSSRNKTERINAKNTLEGALEAVSKYTSKK